MKTIIYDGGHGGSDPGACSGALIEKNMTLVTTKAAAAKSIKYGFHTLLSRMQDTTIGINERVKSANESKADLFISCHYNAGGGDRGEAIHSIYYGTGYELAQVINKYIKGLGQTATKEYSKVNRSGNDYFGVIRDTNMPAIIIEPCFIDSASDRQIADTEAEQRFIGYAIADAVAEFYGLKTVFDVEAITRLYNANIITEPEKWYSGDYTKSKDDIRCLIRKVASVKAFLTYPDYEYAVNVLSVMGIISEPEKWTSGTWTNTDEQWLIRKLGKLV